MKTPTSSRSFTPSKPNVFMAAYFHTVATLRQHVREYVHDYNHQRLHSSLGYQSPVDYERRAA